MIKTTSGYLLEVLLYYGKLYPLFIHKTYETPIGEWMQAECYPTKGFAAKCDRRCSGRCKLSYIKLSKYKTPKTLIV